MKNIKVNEGSSIFMKCWKVYKTEELEEAGFYNFMVNHTYNFINSTTDVHIQKVEKLWGSEKCKNKEHSLAIIWRISDRIT